MDDVWQLFVSQSPGAFVASLAWAAGIAIRAIWKEYKKGRRKARQREHALKREEHDLKKSAVEKGYSVSQDIDGWYIQAPQEQQQQSPSPNPNEPRTNDGR